MALYVYGGKVVKRGSGFLASATSSQVYSNPLGFGGPTDFVPVLQIHDAAHGGTARLIYVKSDGNDSNDGTTYALRVATLTRAVALWTSGRGDWIIVAMGDTIPGGFGNVVKSGESAQYPMVVTTYDSSDPTNVSKMRQGYFTFCNTSSSATPMNTNENSIYTYFENGILNGNPSNPTITDNWSHLGPCAKYHMCFNMIFNPCQVDLQANNDSDTDAGSARLTYITYRGCSFANNNLSGGHNQGMYTNKCGDPLGPSTNGLVIEDCVFYHNGWSGTDRDTGGADGFKHNAYMAVLNWNTVFRRNISGWASSHGLQARGGGTIEYCVFSKNPLNFLVGGGNFYATLMPTGVPYSFSYNNVSGGADINSTSPRGNGGGFINTKSTGLLTHNLFSNCGYTPSDDSYFDALSVATDPGAENASNPSYIQGTNNVLYNWGPRSIQDRINADPHPSICHNNLTNSILPNDTPANGNVTTPSVAHPAPTRTVASWATGPGGFASETAMWDYAVAHPIERTWALTIGAYLQAGYTFTP